jgi:hypothetical protein
MQQRKAASQQGECATRGKAASRQGEKGEAISPFAGHSSFHRAKRIHRPQGISPSAGHSPIFTNNAITRNK